MLKNNKINQKLDEFVQLILTAWMTIITLISKM